MKFPLSAVRLLTAAAFGCVVAVCIGAPQAQAQFVCNPGDGAAATGFDAVACGTQATANGVGATATGAVSAANGVGATANGAQAIAQSDSATAMGSNAN